MATGQGPDLFRSTVTHIDAPLAGAIDARAFPETTLASSPARESRGAHERWGKPLLDATLGPVLAVALSPLIAAVALAVLVTSGRPIFYGSERIGQGGRRFVMWKFRTMVADADAVYERWKDTHPHLATELSTTWQLPHDPRVTPLGGFLRRSSLDELPQLWNVLRGEMSIVGPRPYLEREVMEPALAEAIHSVKPGLTGPFQVRGRKGLSPLTRMEIEANYSREIGFWRDARYMLRTIVPLLKLDGR